MSEKLLTDTAVNVDETFKKIKQAAEDTGGYFHIESQVGIGTTIKAVFDTSNIDYTPLGEVWDTVAILIQMNENLDFVYTVKKDGEEFVCDTNSQKQKGRDKR